MHAQRGLALGFRWVIKAILMLTLGGLSSCGGGGGGGPAPVTNADPTGYYENTGTLTITDSSVMSAVVTTRSDLQGIIYNNRLMMFSTDTNGPNYLYDADISVNGNDVTGTGYAYKDAQMVLDGVGTDITHAIKLSVSGTITQGSTISGTISGMPNTTISFALHYSTAVNALPADMTNIAGKGFQKDWIVASPSLSTNVGGSIGFDIVIRSDTPVYGSIDYKNPVTTGAFQNCNPASNIPVSATTSAAFIFDMTSMTGCTYETTTTVDNRYRGFAVYRVDTVNAVPVMVLIMTNRIDNGLYAINGEFKL